ncbi:MAG: DNA polymerase III subunit alpha [Flavobacteriales bacterium]|nr:DNA polymerase III subunit alpha [Flavobacteriales bacterium]
MYLVFDTETTGLPQDFNAPISNSDNWPRLVQLAWQLHDDSGYLIHAKNEIVYPDGFDIPFNAEKVHGISTAKARADGRPLSEVLDAFYIDVEKADHGVGHNIEFDYNIVGAELWRLGRTADAEEFMKLPPIDTKNDRTTEYCAIPGGKGGKFKWPTLSELHNKLFGKPFDEAHNAAADVEATARSFFRLGELGVIPLEKALAADIMEHLAVEAKKILKTVDKRDTPEADGGIEELTTDEAHGIEAAFSHLHVHTSFSILQSTIKTQELVEMAGAHGMPGVAMTDNGNLMGAFHFTAQVAAYNKGVAEHNENVAAGEAEGERKELKGVVGCELNVCQDHTNKEYKDNGAAIVFLAKNRKGYLNLAKLSSHAHIDGFYYVPRIDRGLVEKYKEGLMVLTGSQYGLIPSLLLNVGEKQAEEELKWWHEQFGDDFYLEICRHGLEEENRVNDVFAQWAESYGIKMVAGNDVFYGEKKDANAQDILLCVRDGAKQSDPIGKGRGFRYGLPNQEFYFRSQEEMKELFAAIPAAIENTNDILNKVENFALAQEVLLPKFDIPEEFRDEADEQDGGNRGENAYLRHLTYQGAKERWGEKLNEEITERLDFELATIENTGYPGYFLIVQDFTSQARKMGVSVGPGRGSAAGSAVAYCIGITNVDPIKYDLLFERFLNPDRVSLPDIDIDFDDRGRDKIIEWVVDKYGYHQVAQIITYGTMAAKSAIRDAARVLDLPLPDADRLAKLVPDTKLKKLFSWSEKERKDKLRSEQIGMAEELIKISEGSDLMSETLNQARILEGSVRNTGIHACGVIITPSPLTGHVPMTTAKDADLLVTQFDNSVVENAGLLKMDFLGLKTLTLIKDAIELVKQRHGIEIDPDEIPLTDEKTYELFQGGETVGIFQYESRGMQKYMKELVPTQFSDLIAMNALYRPGPLEYIPNFIERKHGREEITYDFEDMKEYLEETYGITVYQEQVMLLSQKLAGFTKGEADVLRKAMGKKIFALLAKLKPKFLDGCAERGHDTEIAEKVWKDWEAFAAYAFNKSHSTCYAYVAYQTAYLKANYPAEFMAAVLSNNLNNITDVTFFMEECKRMQIPVLGPDINESDYYFTVNPDGAIRFGLGAIKGVGGGAVEALVAEREENGAYASIFDLCKRVDLRTVNKKTLEGLALAGAFDNFEHHHRALFFHEDNDGRSFLERAMKFGNAVQQQAASAQASLFGGTDDMEIPEPIVPQAEPWDKIEALRKEKEVVGIFITGHPLDDFKVEMEFFRNAHLGYFKFPERNVGKELKVACIITSVEHLTTKTGKPWGKFTMEDYNDSHEFRVFSEDYLKLRHMLVPGSFVYARVRIQQREWVNKQTGDRTVRLEEKIAHIGLLQEVMEQSDKGLFLTIPLSTLDESFNDLLETVLKKHHGKQYVKMRIVDPDEELSVEMPARKFRVDVNKELLSELEEIKGLEFTLK